MSCVVISLVLYLMENVEMREMLGMSFEQFLEKTGCWEQHQQPWSFDAVETRQRGRGVLPVMLTI